MFILYQKKVTYLVCDLWAGPRADKAEVNLLRPNTNTADNNAKSTHENKCSDPISASAVL